MTTFQKMQMTMAGSGSGRMALHLICLCRDGKLRWHSRGIIRELRAAATRFQRGLRLLHGYVTQVRDSAASQGVASTMHGTGFIRRRFHCGT